MAQPILNGLNIQQRKTFLQYAKKFAENCNNNIGQFRTYLEFRDRAYQMQFDQTANRYKELQQYISGQAKRRVIDINVPIILPQIESAVAYQAGVYLSSYPVFGVVSTPNNMDEAIAFETTIANHSVKYGWARELIKVFRNGFKYNFGPALVHWKKQSVPKVVTSTNTADAGIAKIEQQVVGGNCITSLDPYNCFFDMAVDPAKYHEEGEAFGWNILMPRMTFKRFASSLDPQRTTSLREAFESSWMGLGGANAFSALDFFVPRVNPFVSQQSLQPTGTNWLQYVGLEPGNAGPNDRSPQIDYRNYYLVTPFICRALPSDFGKQGSTPTIYFGYIVNWQFVIYVEEISAAHDYLPVLVMQPNEDGLGHQTQSMLDTALPFQDMSSALWNISLESKRRLVFDRLIYNDRYINKADIDPASSVARIPLRNASQFKGEDIGKAIYQIPYREDNSSSNLQMSEMISQMADVAAGQNKVDRGQFQKGNKTKTEFETTMGNSSARQQLTSMTVEHQFMTPVKEIIKSNILLYQGAEKFVNTQSKQEVNVDPVKLRQAMLEFKLTDGLLPAEKLLNTDVMSVFLQTAQALPVVMGEYDIIGMFIYWMKLRGATWLEDFKRQPAAQQQFLDLYKQTSMAGNAQPPEQQLPGVQQ